MSFPLNLSPRKRGAGIQGIATIVAGDFNRRMNLRSSDSEDTDHFWKELNDGNPYGLEFVKGPEGKGECPKIS